MLEYENRDDRWRRQSKEIFEALGRFVVAFESLIHTSRKAISFLVGTTGAPGGRVTTILHHDVMMAKALVDILRAVTNDRLKNDHPPLPQEEREIVAKVIDNVASRFRTLYEKRNALLHGTWYVGWGNNETVDFSEFHVINYKVKPDGLANASDAEAIRTVQHLVSLRLESEALENIVFIINTCVLGLEGWMPSESFYQKDKIWVSRGRISRASVDEP